jgi:outer membrane lipoprotein SlyB
MIFPVKAPAIAVVLGILAGCASHPSAHVGCAQPNYGGAIIGGLAGGLLGAQIGSGSGRIAATAVGAGTGAVIGSQAGCE